MTGTPDAEAAWDEYCATKDVPPEWLQRHGFLAGFAAAEGPWREHLAAQIDHARELSGDRSEWVDGMYAAARIVRGTE